MTVEFSSFDLKRKFLKTVVITLIDFKQRLTKQIFQEKKWDFHGEWEDRLVIEGQMSATHKLLPTGGNR